MNRNEIYKKLYKEIDKFYNSLPKNMKEKLGHIHFYFDFMNFAYNNGLLILAEHEVGNNSITFYLDSIKRMMKVKKIDFRILVMHELGHALGIKEKDLPAKLKN